MARLVLPRVVPLQVELENSADRAKGYIPLDTETIEVIAVYSL